MNFTKPRNVTWLEFCFQKHMICQESPPSPLLPPRPPTHVQYYIGKENFLFVVDRKITPR